MRHPRLLAVAVGLILLMLPIGVALHDRVVTGTAQLSAAAPAQNSVTRWRTAASFRTGAAEGTVPSGPSLAMGTPVGSRTLAGRTWQVSRWTAPWVTPTHAFTEVVPSWNATTPAGSLVQVWVRARSAAGATSSYDNVGTWTTRDGEFHRTSDGAQTDDFVSVDVDTLRADKGTSLRSWQLRIVLLRQPGTPGPTVRMVGAVASQRTATLPGTSRPLYGARTLAVPAYSQMIHKGEYPRYGGGGEAWCSPTSTAMVLGYYHRLPRRSEYAWVSSSYADRWVDHVARRTFDFGYDGTGNWPFNTAAAGQYVEDAFVTRMTSLRDAERFVRAGIPVVASISFGRGQLHGAPISSTAGHLVVIVGFTAAGNVVVNDPAAPSDLTVRRTYDRGELERAWLRRSGGTAYVIHDAAHPLPPRAGHTNW